MSEEKRETRTAIAEIGAPSNGSIPWDQINWSEVEATVYRLQKRIAKATEQGRFGRVKALQKILVRSYHAKLLAVRRITENKGGKTPGVDKVVWRSSNQKSKAVESLSNTYKPKPLRRIYIPKKNGKKRPLGIPTMNCRAHQALHLLGLEPVAEVLGNTNSYGFRAKRGCHDAIAQCFKVFCRKTSARFVLEADIKACFDNISHKWLEENVPMDKVILKQWLKCGYIDAKRLWPTDTGTPQGGIISPTLLNLTLAGLEDKIKSASSGSDKVHVIIYADDFVVSATSKEVLENKVKPVIEKFLLERGLTLSEEKTFITEIEDGFDFLGFNIRKYGGKLIIKPSKDSVKKFLEDLTETVRQHRMTKTEDLIRIINPKIRGWAYYYRHVCSKQIFSSLEHRIFKILWKWAKRRHNQKGSRWVWIKYFSDSNVPSGTLSVRIGEDKKLLEIFRPSTIPITRHIKIRNAQHPYRSDFEEYYKNLLKQRKGRTQHIPEPLPIF